MKKTRRRRNLILAIRSKARIAQQSSLAGKQCHSPLRFNNTENNQGWYQFRKRAQNRLRNNSEGNLVIYENGYRGDHERLWLQDLRCEHVFKSSIKEAVIIGADRACPFCHGTQDMQRYGTVAAVQEHVSCMTLDTIEFLSDNNLFSSKDNYQWQCVFHRGLQIEASFDSFLERKESICPLCDYERATVGQ